MKTFFLSLAVFSLLGGAQAQTAPTVQQAKPLTAGAAHRIVVTDSQAIGRKFRQPSKPGTRPDLRLVHPAEVK